MKKNKTLEKNIFNQNDHSRRQFIGHMGLILGAFGVPWVRRMESMEKISKKIFGSSMAFAAEQSNQPLNVWMVAGRAGIPFSSMLALPQDGDNPANTDRTIMSNPQNNRRITFQNTGSSRPDLILNENALSLQNFSENIFSILEKSNQGHSERLISIENPSSKTSFLVQAAMQNKRSAVIQKPIIFGSQSKVNFSMNAPTQFEPIYLKSRQAFSDMFEAFQIQSPNGMPDLDIELSRNIVSIFVNGFSDILQSALRESRKDGEQFLEGKKNVIQLFNTNLGEELRSFTAQEKADFGIDSIAKQTSLFNGNNAFLHLPEYFAMCAKATVLGAANNFAVVLDGRDYHSDSGTMQNPGRTKPESNYIAQSLAKALETLHNPNRNYKYLDKDLKDITYIPFVSEFFRKLETRNSDFGDGGVNGVVGYAPNVKGASYNDVSSNGELKQFDFNQNTFVNGNGITNQSYWINAALAGIDGQTPSEFMTLIRNLKRS